MIGRSGHRRRCDRLPWALRIGDYIVHQFGEQNQNQPSCSYLLCIYNVSMSVLAFNWDSQKARITEQKDGISFTEAQTVFYDENARLRYDSGHSLDEEQYILLDATNQLRG
jgi:hypothetical protein